MKARAITTAAAVLLLAGTGYGGYRFGQHSADANPGQAAAPARRVLYWQDPMAPGKRFDKPGKSPYMDMDLVPVYADEQGSAAGTVKVSPGVEQNLGIRYAQVRKGSLDEPLRLVGNIAFDERERVLVQARSNGYVERLYVRAPLDKVRQGQALFDLYVPEWVAAQEEYLSIRRMGTAQSAGLADAALQRMRLAGMTEGQIRQVAAHGQPIARVTVTAPASGVISELAAREGMTVATGAPLMTISGLGHVWVNAAVPESAAGRVRPGTRVRATTPAYPAEHFEGKVEALLPQVDPATRTLAARIQLANPDGKLSPGMFADIGIVAAERSETLLVPSEAVIQTGTRSVVIVAEADGRFAPVEVSLGGEANGQAQVLSGLREGQRVVASGQFLIDSEASLRGAVRRLDGEDKAAGQGTAATPTHRASGKIEKIAPGEVTISHGPIPALGWGPMTMGFPPPAAGIPPDLKVGDSVDFELRARPDGRQQIVAIRRRGVPPRHDAGTPSQATPGHGEHMHNPGPAPGHAEHGGDMHSGHGEGAVQ